MGFNRRVIIGVLLVILFVLTMMTNREQKRRRMPNFMRRISKAAAKAQSKAISTRPKKYICGQLNTQCKKLAGKSRFRRNQCERVFKDCRKLLVRRDRAKACKFCDWKSKCPKCPECPECPECGEETEEVEEVVAVTPEEVKETDEVIAEVASDDDGADDTVETYTLSPMPINVEGYRMY